MSQPQPAYHFENPRERKARLNPPTSEDQSSDDSDRPDFPVEVFPSEVAQHIRAVAATAGVPVALPAGVSLGLASAALGKGLAFELSKRTVRPNLYVLATAESGTGKSVTFDHLEEVFKDYQRQRSEEHCKVRPKLLAEKEMLEMEIKKSLRSSNNQLADESREDDIAFIADKKERIDAIDKQLISPRYYCQDFSEQKLAMLLHDHGERMAIVSDEGRIFVDNILGRNTGGKRLEEGFLVKGWSGGSWNDDKVGRDGVSLNDPCVTMVVAVQPDKLNGILAQPALIEGGLFPRILSYHSNAEPKPIGEGRPPIPTCWADHWRRTIMTLLENYSDAKETRGNRFSRQAEMALNEYNDHEFVAKADFLSGVLRPFAARWREQAARVSVVLHALTHGDSSHRWEIDSEMAKKGIACVKWFAGEQLAILDQCHREYGAAKKARALSLLENDDTDHLTARILQRQADVNSSSEAKGYLEELAAEGKLVSKEVMPTGGGTISVQYTLP